MESDAKYNQTIAKLVAIAETIERNYLTMTKICGNITLSNAPERFYCEKREYWRLWEIYNALDKFDDEPSIENLTEVVKKKRMADTYFDKPQRKEE